MSFSGEPPNVGKEPTGESPEIIISPAIECRGQRFTDVGHREAWRAFEQKNPSIRMDDFEKMPYEGAVTSRNRFVSREEAFPIADRNNQLDKNSPYTKLGLFNSDNFIPPKK